MHEIIADLPKGALVLDIGSAGASFSDTATSATVIRADKELPQTTPSYFVRADAAKLPFPDSIFQAVVSNHSLEHFADLEGALREIGRVLCPNGSLFVSVPDASTFTDRLYRWLARGGGHVNAFTSDADLASFIERLAGFKHVATRTLCSSLSFLNRRTAKGQLPRRLCLLGGGYQWTLFLYVWLSRRIDRYLGTRTSIYGWALYFGNIPRPVDTQIHRNVCIRCGAGHAASVLKPHSYARGLLPRLQVYECPNCGTRNPFARDKAPPP